MLLKKAHCTCADRSSRVWKSVSKKYKKLFSQNEARVLSLSVVSCRKEIKLLGRSASLHFGIITSSKNQRRKIRVPLLLWLVCRVINLLIRCCLLTYPLLSLGFGWLLHLFRHYDWKWFLSNSSVWYSSRMGRQGQSKRTWQLWTGMGEPFRLIDSCTVCSHSRARSVRAAGPMLKENSGSLSSWENVL